MGTFLIRFSQSSPTSLALAFVAPDQSVKQVRIDAKQGHGFVMDGVPPALPLRPAPSLPCLFCSDREYASLRDIVDGNASVLRRPAPGGLKNCKYFHGILSFPETEALLSGKPVRGFGTHILWWCFTVAFVVVELCVCVGGAAWFVFDTVFEVTARFLGGWIRVPCWLNHAVFDPSKP